MVMRVMVLQLEFEVDSSNRSLPMVYISMRWLHSQKYSLFAQTPCPANSWLCGYLLLAPLPVQFHFPMLT
jgi:hypothetical protein